VIWILATTAAAMPLQKAAEQLLDDDGTTRTLVVWSEDGEVIADVGGATRVTPASVAKLITAAAVFDAHGGDHRFTTTLSAAGGVEGGVLRGPLVVTGGGDPSLGDPGFEGGRSTDEVLQSWVDEVKAAGIDRVEGDVLADGTAWADPGLGAGWMWDDTPYGFSAAFGPLNLGHNRAVEACPSVGRNAVEPGCCAARQLHRALERAGVEVTGEARVAGLGPALPLAPSCGVAPVPQGAQTELARTLSPPLQSLVGHMLVHSDNLYAEVLARSLADDGTYAATWGVLSQRLVAMGVVEGDVVLADGSGLSRYSLVTARGLVAVLAWVAAQPWAEELLGGLPVAGRSGTLKNRLVEAGLAERVRAKTGSMRGVRNLVGEVVDAEGTVLRFATTSTGFVHGQREARAAEDRVLRLLAISRRGRVARRDLAELVGGG